MTAPNLFDANLPPGIPRVYHYEKRQSEPFLIMQMVGTSLHEMVESQPGHTLSIRTIARLMKQIVS